VPGIDLPYISALMLRNSIEQEAARLRGPQRVMVFACAGSHGLAGVGDEQTSVITLRCMAHLPPSFIDYILSRNHADGVYLAGCSGGGCNFRLGAEWTTLRVARERDPQLRERTDRNRLALAWTHPWHQQDSIRENLRAFRSQLSASESGPAANTVRGNGSGWRNWPLQAVAYTCFWVVAAGFSAWPVVKLLEPGEAMVSLSIVHSGQRIQPCRSFTQEELDELPPNMRRPTDCPREKHPLRVEFKANDMVLYSRVIQPTGIWSDGSAPVYARFPLPAGNHLLQISMSDSGKSEQFDYVSTEQIKLEPEQHLVVRFDSQEAEFIFQR
jgi:coenzyme F420-reducing hydrogenase delta subunit